MNFACLHRFVIRLVLIRFVVLPQEPPARPAAAGDQGRRDRQGDA